MGRVLVTSLCLSSAVFWACGGDVRQDGRAAGAAGSGGSGVSGGGSGGVGGIFLIPGAGGLASIPPPPDDSCAPFKEVFTGTASNARCSQLSCPCDQSFFSWVAKRGCLVSVDCSVVCADTVRFSRCLTGYDPCSKDADCSPGFCVIETSQSSGECASGTEGARCRTDEHCPGGKCVAVDATGLRECTSTKEGSYCNDGGDCESGHCLFVSTSLIGTCSS